MATADWGPSKFSAPVDSTYRNEVSSGFQATPEKVTLEGIECAEMLPDTIEVVVNEYFSLNSKQSCTQLENLMLSVKQSKDKWAMCSYLLFNKGDSANVLWFTLTLFEDILITGSTSQALSSSPIDAAPNTHAEKYVALFNELLRLLQLKFNFYPPHIKTKMLKLFVNMQIFYDHYINFDTFSFLESITLSNPLFAFSVLRVYSEELSVHPHLSFLEKKRKGFVKLLPNYFEFVFRFMTQQLPSSSFRPYSNPLTPDTPTHPLSLLGDKHVTDATKVLLDTLHHILATVPTMEYFTVRLMDALFFYSSLSVHPHQELHLAAMSCISEAMGKTSLLVHIPDYSQKMIPQVLTMINQLISKDVQNNDVLAPLSDE
jgi:hypothetical protein